MRVRSRGLRGRAGVGARLVLAALLFAAATGASRAEYLLSPGDTLRLRALKWDPVTGLHSDWQGLSGDYGVSSDGRVSIPLVGEMQAAGKAAGMLAERIGEVLQRRVGMPEPPFVALEVSGHAPVYVLGAAAAPGAYPFRPGLTVQQAVALAGGHAGPTAAASGDGTGAAIRAEGEVRLLSARVADLEAARDRLRADLALLGDGGADAGSAPDLPEVQRKLLAATETGRRAEAESLRALKTTLEAEHESLVAQITLREDQIVDAEAELADVSSLRDRGLAANARVSSLAARASDLESQRLQLEVARLGVTQQMNEVDRALAALRDDARAERLAELGDVESRMAEARIRLATARTLRDLAVAAVGSAVTGPTAATWRHRVSRVEDGRTVVLDLAPGDPLRPGDTLEVVLDMPRD